ncbi:MAG: hypothetical protein LBN41_10930 [Enterobacteriaceae bacterium]|jgi:hypothetical protein|nr:hypothetical protein [Enterobacteriaceae bacterium]
MILSSSSHKVRKINPLLAIIPPLLLLFLLPFLRFPAALTIVIALFFLAVTIWWLKSRKRLAAILIFTLLSTIWIWQSYFTWQGYFWIHARELDALAAKITAYGKIRSLEIGTDNSFHHADGETSVDEYRFLNGTHVTHQYQGIHSFPDSDMPGWFIDSYCQQNNISLKVYYELVDELQRLKLNGFSLMSNGDISFNLWTKRGVPWTINLVRIADATHPLDSDTLEKLNTHWYIATYS